jgi:adenosylhomocysteine nucleosidase
MRALSVCLALCGVIACRARDDHPSTVSGSAAREAHEAPVAVAVLTAVDYEFDAVVGLLTAQRPSMVGGRQLVEGSFDGARVVAIRAGYGKAHAAGATALVIERYHPARVLMAGIAGSLGSSAVDSGDVVIVSASLQHDLGSMTEGHITPWTPKSPTGVPLGATFDSSPELVDAMYRALQGVPLEPWTLAVPCSCADPSAPQPCPGPPRRVGRDHPRACAGVAATGDVFLADPTAAAAIVQRSHSVIVDMETAAVAQEANNYGVPFAGIRVTADVVASEGGTLYECLIPYTGKRLSEVVRAALPILIAPPKERAPPAMPCTPGSTAATIATMLQQSQEKVGASLHGAVEIKLR